MVGGDVNTMSASKAMSQRQLRVGEELRHALAEVLSRGVLRDPDVAGASVTVTEVRVGPDLRNATAYIMPLGGADIGPVIAGLNRAAPFLRREVARRVRLRFATAFVFRADTAFETATRIDRLLSDPAVAADIGDDGDGA